MNQTIALESLIPHRKPMLLVDSILQLGDDEILAETTIQADAFFLQGHYPDYPIVPGVITCECLFQAGAALLSHRLREKRDDGKVPVIARIENAKFRGAIRPGDRVFLLVKLKEELGGVFFLKGEARVGDRLATSVEFACALTERQA